MKILKRVGWISLGIFALAAVGIGIFLWVPKRQPITYDDLAGQLYYINAADTADGATVSQAYVSNSGQNFFVREGQLAQLVRQETMLAQRPTQKFYDSVTAAPILFTPPTQALLNMTEAVSDAQVMTATAFYGTKYMPYPLTTDKSYQASFAKRGDEIYFTFVSNNEYVSLLIEQPGHGMAYELYDAQYKKVAAAFSKKQQRLEIKYRGVASGRYILRVMGSPATPSTPFRIVFPTDENQWSEEMKTVSVNGTVGGSVDYFGDEDFFVLDEVLRQNIDAVCMKIEQCPAAMTVTAYDKEHRIIGRFFGADAATGNITLYGLQEVYAISLCSADGGGTKGGYSVRFFHSPSQVLGIETFGFVLSPVFDSRMEGENYYTAVLEDLQNKRIVDIQVTGAVSVSMTMTTYTGAKIAIKEGDVLPLHHGKSTITIRVDFGKGQREITLALTDKESYHMSYAYVQRKALNVRAEAGSRSKKLATVQPGDKVWDLGVSRSDGDSTYRKIELTDGSGIIGWVVESYLFTDYTPCKMPATYAAKIQALQAAHPKWKFTFVSAGTSFDAMVEEQLAHQTPKVNGKAATRRQVEYYLNPFNFLDETQIFMFEKQNYQGDEAYSVAGIDKVWAAKSETLHNEAYYIRAFGEAGRISGTSPYFVTSRAAIESGYGTSRLASGEVSASAGYYNFYGISAYDNNPSAGGTYAKQQGWNTQRRAIVEGADWIKNNYINALQYTPYFLKFSLVPGREWHQYMTDLQAPATEANILYKAHAYGGTLNEAKEFVIPVYSNLP